MKKQVLAVLMLLPFLPSLAAQAALPLGGGRSKTFESSYVKSTRKENQKLFGKSYNSISEKIEQGLRQELERRGLTQVEKLDGPCCRITLDLRNVNNREPENFSESIGCHRDCLIVETAANITITDRNAAVLYQRAYAGTSLGVFDPGQMLDPLAFLKVRDLACRSLVKRIVEDEGLLTILNSGVSGLSPDSGSVADNTYNNDFFRFGYPFPAGWQVRSKEAQKAVMERGHEIIYGTSPNGSYNQAGEEHREALKLASFLFAADEHPPDAATGSSVQIVVFDLASDISFRTAEEQLTSLLDSAKFATWPSIASACQVFVRRTPVCYCAVRGRGRRQQRQTGHQILGSSADAGSELCDYLAILQ